MTFDTNLIKEPLSTDVLSELDDILTKDNFVNIRNPQKDFFSANTTEKEPFIKHIGIQTYRFDEKLDDYLTHLAQEFNLEYWHVHKTAEASNALPHLIYHAHHYDSAAGEFLQSNVNPKRLFGLPGMFVIQDMEAYNNDH